MPNHLHGILNLGPVPEPVSGFDLACRAVRTRMPVLGDVVRSFKASTTRIIRTRGLADFEWQRGLYESIIQDEADLYEARDYVRRNPEAWEHDRETRLRGSWQGHAGRHLTDGRPRK